MGQCGQGHSQSPVSRPRKVVGLDGVAIQQISAGTSHTVAWTAIPSDRCSRTLTDTCVLENRLRVGTTSSFKCVHRQVVTWHRPFCVDLQEETFSLLRRFLERYCEGFSSAVPPAPFPDKEYVLAAQRGTRVTKSHTSFSSPATNGKQKFCTSAWVAESTSISCCCACAC